MKWINVEERLTEISGPVLIYILEYKIVQLAFYSDSIEDNPGFFSMNSEEEDDYFTYPDVTHWMELSEPANTESPHVA